jgi:hypothetical protein
MSVGFQQTTRCYVPEDRTLYNHRREHVKYYFLIAISQIYNSAVMLYEVYQRQRASEVEHHTEKI